MPNQPRTKRKYKIRSENFISHIIACVKSVPENEIRLRLDEYEQQAIRNPKQWATTASMEEVMVITTKLGFQSTYQMVDERNPLRTAELLKATRRLYQRKNFDELLELIKKHKYFVFTGDRIMKVQSFVTLVGDGVMYKPSPDSSRLLKSARHNDVRNQKNVDDFVVNVFRTKRILGLNALDIYILFLIRKFDDLPVATELLYDELKNQFTNVQIHKHLTKLYQYGYLHKWGLKKASMYGLNIKGWQVLIEIKKEYFRGIRFWESNEAKQAYQPYQILDHVETDETSNGKSESKQKHIA